MRKLNQQLSLKLVNWMMIVHSCRMEMIYSLKAKPPKRIERRLLRLQQYKLNIKYRPDNSNPANVLSRQPLFTDYRSSTTAKSMSTLMAAKLFGS